MRSPKELTETAKRLAEYRARLKAAGFIRISAFISPELHQHIEDNRRQGDCTGRILEREILGEFRPRPWKV